MTSQALLLFFLGVVVVVVGGEKNECLCTHLPTGQWKVVFEEPVAIGVRKEGRIALQHLYNEIYYGALSMSTVIPFGRFNMDYMGYLNGTNCKFRGSIAQVFQRISIAFKVEFDGDKEMKGTYHRMTAFGIDEEFHNVHMTLEKTDLDVDLEEMMIEKKKELHAETPSMHPAT